jgi:hypothetical protein
MRPPGVPSTYPPGAMRPLSGGMPMRPPVQQAPTPAPRPVTPVPMGQPTPHGMQPPMQAMQPRPMPMQPMPMHMQPRPVGGQVRRGTPVWLWIVIGVTFLVLVGAAMAISQHNGKNDDHGGGSSSSRPMLDGDRVAAGLYHLRLPFGFVETSNAVPAAEGLETHSYTGSLGDGLATIVTMAISEDITTQADSDLEDGCGDLGRNFFGGGLHTSRAITGHGSQRFRCTIGGGGQTAEAALYTTSRGAVIVFFSASESDFDDLAAARDELFDTRVEEPGG